MNNILFGESRDRSKDKVFNCTLIAVKDGETWTDGFATKEGTEAAALSYARRLFPYCAVLPARSISLHPKRLFLLGMVAGFLIALFLIATLSFIIFNNI